MPLTTLTACPSLLRAGDTLLFAVSPADYPPPDWAISYSFRAPLGSAIDISGVTSGNEHLVSITPAVTSGWTPALYSGVAKAVGPGGATFSFWTGTLEILPDLSAQTPDYDTRTHARKCLDAINAVMLGKASKDVLSSSIAGVSISRLAPEQLITWRNYYAAEVKAEEQNLAAANGQATGNNILVRFG